MNSKDAELDQYKYLLSQSEQAREDVRNSLLEAAENVKSIQENDKNTHTQLLTENKALKESNSQLYKAYFHISPNILKVMKKTEMKFQS